MLHIPGSTPDSTTPGAHSCQGMGCCHMLNVPGRESQRGESPLFHGDRSWHTSSIPGQHFGGNRAVFIPAPSSGTAPSLSAEDGASQGHETTLEPAPDSPGRSGSGEWLKKRGMQEWLSFPGRMKRCWCLTALPALISTSQPSTAYSNCIPSLLLEIASVPNMHFYINKGTKWPFTSLCNVFFNGRS